MSNRELQSCLFLVSTDSSDKLRQPKIGALMKQVMGTKEDVPGTFSRGGETLCAHMLRPLCSLLAPGQDRTSRMMNESVQLIFRICVCVHILLWLCGQI